MSMEHRPDNAGCGRGVRRPLVRRLVLTFLVWGLAVMAGLPAVAPIPAALAVVEIDITRGNLKPVPIALPEFLGGSAQDIALGKKITQVISADLERSGLFETLDPASFIERITNADRAPRFSDWRIIKAEALVTGRISKMPDGRVKAEFRLWDVFAGRQLTGEQFFTKPQKLASHRPYYC